MAAIPAISSIPTVIPGRSSSRPASKSATTGACICRTDESSFVVLVLNNGSCPGFPVARLGELAQDPGHESGQVRQEAGSETGKEASEAAGRCHRGGTAELSARACADQARHLAGRGLRRGGPRSAGG